MSSRHTNMHFNTLIDVHCINKKDLFSELLRDLKALACPKKKILKINLRQLNKGKCNIAVKIKSVPSWSVWLGVRIWLTCGHSSAVWLLCSNSKIATQARVMKNRSVPLATQQTGCIFFSLCSSIYLVCMVFFLIWCFSIAEAAFCQCRFTSDVPSAIF